VIGASRQGRGGPDRWLVSYADLVTLLMAFFTVMYALSNAEAAKARAEVPVPSPAPPVAEPRANGGPAAVRVHLTESLSDAIASGRIEVTEDARGVVLSLPESATFAVASADVTGDATALLGRLAETLRSLPNPVRVEGHTDDSAIRTARFSSNWELSTARASAVVALFIALQIDPSRLSAAGYGEFHPKVANDSAAGRAANRRVDIVIVPADARQIMAVEGGESR
jgi:chemotaxis protein MotB